MNVGRLVRLITFLIGFAIGFALLFVGVLQLGPTEGTTLGDAILLGGVTGLLLGYVLYFVEGRVDSRMHR
jgi:hypothetical protein